MALVSPHQSVRIGGTFPRRGHTAGGENNFFFPCINREKSYLLALHLWVPDYSFMQEKNPANSHQSSLQDRTWEADTVVIYCEVFHEKSVLRIPDVCIQDKININACYDKARRNKPAS